MKAFKPKSKLARASLSQRKYCFPAPGSTASSWRRIASASYSKSNVDQSSAKCTRMAVGSTRATVTWSSMRAPKAAKASRYFSGKSSSDGPVSKRWPSMPSPPKSSERIRPPTVSFFSNKVTSKPARAKRPAMAKPPTPAPTTTAVLPFGDAPPMGGGNDPLLATAEGGTGGAAPKRSLEAWATTRPRLRPHRRSARGRRSSGVTATAIAAAAPAVKVVAAWKERWDGPSRML
mmetsp:Transcript_24503/g.61290  ORF Transcript_24503/g.61290 Transcript_24503/m.61290 type:complete len:233 (-) Transcript_24503:184-882(-)